MFRAEFVEFFEDSRFDLQVFDSCFDDEVDVFHVIRGTGYEARDASHRCVFVFLGHFAFGDLFGQLFFDFSFAASDEFVFNIVQDDVPAVRSENLGNARTHCTCTNNHYFTHV